ncbi:MAG TPA: DEAD/DEAH box helicase [Prolixibacteraceae bacterium]|nr:DEAD/DEAH box helicase [Prolixibacteraceae bacterium]
MTTSTSISFNLLDSRVQKWIWQQGWSGLKVIQENSIPYVLHKDCDIIISATTAGGKTEAAFLPIITSLLANANSGYSVLYISPLKALINDQFRRISDMVNGLPIDVIAWHGDIDASRKKKSLKCPNGILIITPESLESFFINRQQYLTLAFSNLSYIVVDELHAFIGTERGKQLQSLLARMEHIAQRPIPRIALSATFSDYEIVKKYLRVDQTLPCFVPSAGVSDHELKVIIKEYNSKDKHENEAEISEDIYNKLRGDNNLIFANSRLDVETFASLLTELSENNFVPNEFRVHHGSLSKNERESVEQELQNGKFPISAVCTSTLELGVDIGKVKSIVQIGSANSVSSLRQRLGRSGRRGEASILRIYSIDDDRDTIEFNLKAILFQNIAVVELLRENRYERPNTSKYHFSTLIQQILSILSQFGGFQVKDGWNHLCKTGAFSNVSPQLFMELLKSLGEKQIVSQTHTNEIIVGIEGEKIIKSQSFYVAFQTSLDYTLIIKETQKQLGALQYLPNVNEFIIFGGRKWKVVSTDDKLKKIFITQVRQGIVPFFYTESPEIDGMIVRKMKDIYQSNNAIPYLDANGRKSLEEGRTFFFGNKLQNLSYFTYGDRELLLTWSGQRVNRTISLMAELVDGISRPCNPIAVTNITNELVDKLKMQPKPNGVDLASLFHNRKQKENQKYDYLLSDKLLDLEYIQGYLDIDAAWEKINSL